MNEFPIKENLHVADINKLIIDNFKAFQCTQNILLHLFQNINTEALELITYLQDNLNKSYGGGNNKHDGINSSQINPLNQNIFLNNFHVNTGNINELMNSQLINKTSDNFQNLPATDKMKFENISNFESNKDFLSKHNIINNLANSNISYKQGKYNDNENKFLTPNKALKEKFFELKANNNKRYFQIVYMFRNKIKRMYRIDCMTRKINVNFYHYIRENHKRLNLTEELVEFFRNNIRYTSRNKFVEIDKKYPHFKDIYDEYLRSDRFKKLILSIKLKYDDEYLKLFFRHSRNFLNFYLKESLNPKENNKNEHSSQNGEDITDKNIDDISLDSNENFENEDEMYADEITEDKKK